MTKPNYEGMSEHEIRREEESSIGFGSICVAIAVVLISVFLFIGSIAYFVFKVAR